MIRILPVWIELAVLVFCLIDCIQADSALIRNLSKTFWVILIIILPLIGGVAWLVAGRPQSGQGTRTSVPWPATRTAGFPEHERPTPPRGPDDDPDFLADLRASDTTHERMLAEWQEQLRLREEKLRQADPGTSPAAPPLSDEPDRGPEPQDRGPEPQDRGPEARD